LWRDGRARVCVATDVAARGIDLPNLALVIHADLPNDAESLQHRSGRTGRAGRKGVSVLLVPGSRRRLAEQLLNAANVQPIWSGPPMADEIRKLDQERLLVDPLLCEDNSEDELVIARALLAQRPAEDIAAALVRVYRSRLPAPEEVLDPGPSREPRERRPGKKLVERSRPERGQERAAPYSPQGPSSQGHSAQGRGIWFRLDIGRKNNADPKWLLPMLCNRGKITRQDIGAIRIFDTETKFEVAVEAAEQFSVNIKRTASEDGHITAVNGAPERGLSERAPPRARAPHNPPRETVSVSKTERKKRSHE
jgi:ATP-dependent RNA helicase DeaD